MPLSFNARDAMILIRMLCINSAAGSSISSSKADIDAGWTANMQQFAVPVVSVISAYAVSAYCVMLHTFNPAEQQRGWT